MLRSRIGQFSLVLVTAGACASSAGPRNSRRDPNLITRNEIDETRRATAYDVVLRLRPAWLTQRSSSYLIRVPWLIVDGTHRGTIENLREIMSETIEQIRYFTPEEALTRWGDAHPAGAIEIKTLATKGGR